MYQKSFAYYDAIYSFKDYGKEAQQIHALIQQHQRSPGDALLDVACGTGQHIAHLRQHYAAEGLDIEPGLLDVARQRNPGVLFHQGDMADFDLGCRFAAVLCLFSAIGYVQTVERLRRTLQTFARHTEPGGVVIVEPWFTPETFHAGHIHARLAEQPDLKVARMSVSQVRSRMAISDMHYMVATSQGVAYFSELHELGLFTDEEYKEAFRAARLEVTHDADGLTGRGLYIGVRA